jgi:hypothetical protein
MIVHLCCWGFHLRISVTFGGLIIGTASEPAAGVHALSSKKPKQDFSHRIPA